MPGMRRVPKQSGFVRSLARTFRSHARLGFCLYGWLLLLCAPLHAIDRDRRLDQLHHTSWTYIEGAPGQVRALAQTTDGYLWLGTATGLFRFDGVRFQFYKPQSGQAFPQRNIVSLFATPDGGLWVGNWYGGVSYIKNDTVTEYGTAEGLPSAPILAFARDRHGVIWAAAGKDGLARLEGSRWKKIAADFGFAAAANTVFVDHAGTVWVGTPTSVAYLPESGTKFQIAAQGLQRVRGFAESSDGTLWMAETGYGVRPVPLPGENENLAPEVLVGSQAITFDSQGSLWITSLGSGIRRVPNPQSLRHPKIHGASAWQFRSSEVEAFTQRDGLTSDYIYCVLQDREGNIWIGASGGLDRFRQSPVVSVAVQPISPKNELPIPSLNSFTTSALAAGDRGTVWAAGIGPQVLLNIKDEKVANQLRDQIVDCAYRDQQGAVWFATDIGIFRLADERRNPVDPKHGREAYNYQKIVPAGQGLTLRQLNLPKSGGIGIRSQSRVKALTQDRVGRLWVSMDSGTFRLEKSGWTSLESLGGPQGTATAEFTDSEGRAWFGFATTVAMVDGDKVSIFSDKDGVQIGAVTSIHGRAKEIWIGGESGLEFFDGNRFQSVKGSDGSAFAGISGIVSDSNGGLWFSEHRGIIHMRESSRSAEFESFGLLDGLTAELRGTLATPSVVQTTDGRIWFATTKGVAWIDPNPARAVRNTVPPPVLIESVTANGAKYDKLASLRLPSRITHLQITYTATSLTVPERVRFRYKLEGQDKDWQDSGTQREAIYTNLDAGSYTFHVIASNNDGVWNETGGLLNFSVAPAYYQTNWFRGLFASAILLLLWMAYLIRLRYLRRQFAMTLDARVGERTRIARELHDTLLQSLHGLLFQFQAARNMLPGRTQDAIRTLDGAISRTEQAITESRSAIQGLRHESPSQTDLAQNLATMAQDLASTDVGDDSPEFRVIAEGERRNMSPIVEEEVGQMARELLRNAFQHARARQIEIEIHYDDQLFRVRVRDDGKGMDRDVMNHGGRAGHWGLTGLRERAQRIGAQLDFWSEVEAGTEIQITVPAAVAYKARSGAGSTALHKAKS